MLKKSPNRNHLQATNNMETMEEIIVEKYWLQPFSPFPTVPFLNLSVQGSFKNVIVW